MQRLEVSGVVRPMYGSLGVKRLNSHKSCLFERYGIRTAGQGRKHKQYMNAPHRCVIMQGVSCLFLTVPAFI